MDFLCRVIEADDQGRRHHDQPARHGRAISTPDETREFFRSIRSRVPHGDDVIFSTHCHDDLGLAVANSLAAVEGGARQIECTVNGIGERAGNAVTGRGGDGVPRPVRSAAVLDLVETRQLYPSSEMLTALTGQSGAGEQGDRRAQCLLARGRHPPGRHAEGSPDLRDHARRGRGGAVESAGAWQALGPSRGAAPLCGPRVQARGRRAAGGLPRADGHRRRPEDPDRRRHPRGRGLASRAVRAS